MWPLSVRSPVLQSFERRASDDWSCHDQNKLDYRTFRADEEKSGARWGNKFGMLLLPVHCHKGGSDPLQFVKRAKEMMDKKKLSLEGPFSYKIADFVMSFFGPIVLCFWCVATKLTQLQDYLQDNFYNLKCDRPSRRYHLWREPHIIC